MREAWKSAALASAKTDPNSGCSRLREAVKIRHISVIKGHMPRPSPAMIWKKLAEYSRGLAEDLKDPRAQACLSEIARNYEALAQLEAASDNTP